MVGVVARSLIALAAACVGSTLAADAAGAKIPLDYRAYDGWNAIRGTAVSDDGRYAAYALVPEDGDPVLILHDFATGADRKEQRGTDPAFTADARFVVYTLRAPNAEIHAAQRKHKKPDESPKNGLGILDVATGSVVTIDRVKDFKLPADAGSDILAYRLEPSPSPNPSPDAPSATSNAPPAASGARASPASRAPGIPAPSGPPTPTSSAPATPTSNETAAPSPSASPDDLHAKDPTTTLIVRDLTAATQTAIDHVSGYAIAHDGSFVAYALQSKDGRGDSVDARLSGSGRTLMLLGGPGHFKNLTFAPKTPALAFVSDAATFASAAPQYALYHCDLSSDPANAAARLLVDRSTAGLGASPPSEYGSLRYSEDGTRLFFGTAPAPTPVPSGTPEPIKVDIWNWQDLDLQSEQRKHADDERKRTFTAVVSTDGAHPAQLASGSVREIISNENPRVAIGIDDLRYRRARSWDSEFADFYAVSLVDGARRLLIAKQRTDGASTDEPLGDAALSPHGAFVVAYDAGARAWFSVDTHSGARRNLTARLKPAFYDELDDHPAPPPPYGFAGWIDGDRFALLRDRYDLWAVDPRTGTTRLLTGGVGRKHHVSFVPEKLASDEHWYDSAKPIVLEATDETTREHGIWRVTTAGSHAFEPQPVMMLPKALTFAAKARHADRVVFFEQTFSEMRNLWSAPSFDAPFTRISDANPQRANYLWGDEQLVSYHSTWGVPLRGILYTPDNFDPHKKYPLLVYFYERFSDLYHEMAFTTPAPNTSPTLVRYVSHGYVVFVPDVAYRIGHPGESALNCILPGIDSIVRRGFIDAARIGIAGHSWAAYQIAYMLTRTNRFRAAEAGAAVANMTSAYGGIRLESGRVREFQYEVSQSRIGATPWDRTDLYVENSALFHIRNVNTPYLTIANDQDGAVPQLQGIEFFTALRRLGKEAYLFSFDGEDHNLRGREQQKYWTVHLDEFFDHFLQGKPAPDWMTHGVDFLHRGQRDIDRDFFGETF